MIDASITNEDAVVDRLAALGSDAAAALQDAAGQIGARLLEIADRNLSGGVLKARTGRLRASLAATTDISSDGIRSVVSANTPYAAFQEYGFAGFENVRAYLRRQTVAFGHPISPVEVQVKAHARSVDYAAHSYLRAALAELAPEIDGLLESSLAKVLQP